MARAELADVLDIQDLIYTYAAANDERDLDTIAACFGPEGSFGLRVAGQEPVGPVAGADLVDFYAGMLGAQTDQRRHVITNVRVRALGDQAWQATSYFTLLVTDGGVTDVLTAGVYTDHLSRSADGTWTFAAKWLELDAAP